MKRLTAQLHEQQAAAAKLDDAIKANLKALGLNKTYEEGEDNSPTNAETRRGKQDYGLDSTGHNYYWSWYSSLVFDVYS